MAVLAPTVVATASGGPVGSSTSQYVDIAVPGGFKVGDLLLVAITHNGLPNSAPDWTPPSGFNRVGIAMPTTGEGRITGFFAMPITSLGQVPTTARFFTGGAGSFRGVGVLLIIRGAKLSDFVSGYSNSYPGAAVAGGASTLAYAVDAPSLAVLMGANESVAGVSSDPASYPSDYTERGKQASNTGTTGTRTVIWVGTKAINSAGAVDAAAVTWGGTSGVRAQGIAIRGAEETTSPGDDGGTTPGGGSSTAIFKLRRGTATQIAASTRILADGEPGYDKTNKVLKIGDGVSTWAQLPSITPAGVVITANINTIPPGTPAGAVVFQSD